MTCASPTITSAQSAAGQTAEPANDRAGSYRVNAGDELEVYVWGEERLQRNVRVLPDGSFSFPLAGQVRAQGRTLADIEQQIAAGLKSQFRDQVPQITVSVVNPAGLQYSVIGKVRTPGNFAPGRNLNVLEAIGIAGGPTEFAEVGNIVILRRGPGGLSAIRVRLTNLLRGNPGSGDLAADGVPNLVSGDTVVVP